ncbi:YciI family protein [Pseudoduganella armeniaca]|uniref:Transcription initiation protein n=1 Tax=Pseudoduganella armeniaca TaxID=2072590 RepID=A0A2R4CAI9_9BURK|nr:YciI family protein [Pseudoduganella armeniaca]AVR96518.1 transcription initiation protein [Pseudoduganella armeniaca]
MTKFLISFPASAMDVPADDMPAVAAASRAVIREAKTAGVYVFGGGINAGIAPVMVAPDGGCTAGTHPQTREFDGGFCVLELPSRDVALQWAARLATACRCAQELREFHYDPES